MTVSQNYENQYLLYDGPFSIEIISTLAKSLQENIIATDYVKKKLYRVFIELTQNVALYSFDKVLLATGASIGKGKTIVQITNDTIICTTTNKILKEHSDILINNCLNINKSNPDDLREEKKTLRKMSTIKDTRAHIGLIMVSIYSGNDLNYEVINENTTGSTYFKISATIHKKTY